MSGSRRFFGYTDDGGEDRFIQLDESNGESADLGLAQAIANDVYSNYANRISPSRKFPLEPRYILAERADSDGRIVRRRFIVGSVTAPAWGASARTVQVSGETYGITAKVGEVRHLAPSTDTGLIDGDVEDQVAGGGT